MLYRTWRYWIVLGLLMGGLCACTSPTAAGTPIAATSTPPPVSTATAVPPTATPVPPTATAVPPTATALPPTPAPSGEDRPEEAILILEPGPGSRLVSPIHVAGLADPTFEQNLVVRIILDDGTILLTEPTTIQADVGQRGPFALDVAVTVSGERQAFIQVFATSPRDGSITHLNSVGVTLLASGQATILPVTPYQERIVIEQPVLNAPLSGGMVHVAGWALASFEGTLVVDVLDEAGNVVGSQPLIVQAPDMGQPGPFSADVPYRVAAEGPGTIVVRDPSVVFDGDVHRASVNVILKP